MASLFNAIEDFYFPVGEDIQTGRSAERVEIDRALAWIFFGGDEALSSWRLHQDILGGIDIGIEQITKNILASGRKMGGKIRKAAMDNLAMYDGEIEVPEKVDDIMKSMKEKGCI